MAIAVGTLPPIVLPIALSNVDVTAGVLTLPASLAGTTGFFVPVTGFPLGLITGIVVTAANGPGSFSSPNGAYLNCTRSNDRKTPALSSAEGAFSFSSVPRSPVAEAAATGSFPR